MTDLLTIPEGMELEAVAFRPRPAPPAPPVMPAPIEIGYCAERHVGLVANDKSAAAENTKRLNAWLASKFTEWPIHFSGKTFYFQGRIQTGLLPGCVLVGTGGPPLLGDLDKSGMQTRFVRIDPDPDDCVLLVRCGGFQVRGTIQLFGRVLKGNVNSGTGPKTGAGLAIEGRTKPYPTNNFNVDTLGIADCDKAIHFLNGYYDDAGKFVVTGDMASAAKWGQVTIHNCRVAVQSDNVNATWHTFEQIFASKGPDPLEYVFKINAGGRLMANVHLVAWDTTLVGVDEFSPNTNRIDIHLSRDTRPVPANRLTLFEYMGKAPRDFMEFGLRVSGDLGGVVQAEHLRELFRFNGLNPNDLDIQCDLMHLRRVPVGDWKWDKAGPWWRVVK